MQTVQLPVQQPVQQSSAIVRSNCVQCQRNLKDTGHPWCNKACRDAYNAAATARGEVCQQCKQNAKHPAFPFCGNDCRQEYKKSAAARGDLCMNCNKRVKQPGHDFCSKTCGSQATAAAAVQASQIQAQTPAAVPTTFGAAITNAVRQGQAVQGANAGRSSRPSRPHTSGHPPTLAQLPTANTGSNIAQPVPTSISTMAANVNKAPRPRPAPTPQNTMQPPATNAYPQNNGQAFTRNGQVRYATAPPAAQLAPSPTASPAPVASGLLATLNTPLTDDDGNDDGNDVVTNAVTTSSMTCLLSGCSKPVYVSRDGRVSHFCGRSHALESVSQGQQVPCIRCGQLPQQDEHSFCGNKCLVKSLFKSRAA